MEDVYKRQVVDGGKVKLDGKVVKAAAEVKVGQVLEIEYYNKYFKFEILQVPLGNVSKDKTSDLVKLIETKGLDVYKRQGLLQIK